MRPLMPHRLLLLPVLIVILFGPLLLSARDAIARSGGTVYFNRPAGFIGAFTQPEVLIDGKRVGTIGSGQCRRLNLPPGHHQIIVRDQTSLLSRFSDRLFPTIVSVGNNTETFVTVEPLRDMATFNEPSPSYNLLVSSRGARCR